jgi:hypothetical protein
MRKPMAAMLAGLTLAVALAVASCVVTPPPGAVVAWRLLGIGTRRLQVPTAQYALMTITLPSHSLW